MLHRDAADVSFAAAHHSSCTGLQWVITAVTGVQTMCGQFVDNTACSWSCRATPSIIQLHDNLHVSWVLQV